MGFYLVTPTLKPYLAIILAATDAPLATGVLTGSAAGVGDDSCSEGGGAMATPPTLPLSLSTPPSSSSSLSGLIAPAKLVAMFGIIGFLAITLSSGPGSNRL